MINKLERWAEKELQNNLDKMIIDVNNGWLAFGRYYIKSENGFCNVYDYSGDCLGEFSNKRSAISWCVADKNNNLNLARNIKTLDSIKMKYEDDIYCRRQLAAKSKSLEFRDIVETKIQPQVDAVTHIKAELEKCIYSAKYIQIRGFLNETARLSRS